MTADFPDDRELILTRLIDAPREKVFRCWTEPELLKQWFAPKPWTTPFAELDVRPGGTNLVTMRSPEGQDMGCPGLYLEVVPNEKLVFTDAFVGAWAPRDGHPFMLAVLTFEDEGGKTRVTARIRHWTTEDAQRHEAVSFHQEWGTCAA